MRYDDDHHAVAIRLLSGMGIDSIEASLEDDINSVADRMIGHDLIPMGMKRRGANSQNDYNLSAWSEAKGNLPEFSNAGGKLYLYWMKTAHVLVEFPAQDCLNQLLPDRWKPIFGHAQTKQLSDYAWVRARSEGSNVQQGVIFVPNEMVVHRVIWGLDESLEFLDKDWYQKVSVAGSSPVAKAGTRTTPVNISPRKWV